MRELRRRNRRPNTLRAYLYELFDFGEWLLENEVGSLPELTRAHIEGWQDQLIDRAVAPNTQQVAATAVRGLLKWAVNQDLPMSSPSLWLKVTTPRVLPGDPRPISQPDLAILRHALEPAEPHDLWRLRTRALFFTTFSSGGRLSEILSLRRGAFHERTARVIQKGGRPHHLVISELALAAIADYEALRTDQSPALFISLNPDRFGQPMDKREVQQTWDALCLRFCIHRFTTHQLRHSCASTLRRNGVDIVLIAKHLGQRGLQTIQRYTEVDIDERRQAVALLDGALAG